MRIGTHREHAPHVRMRDRVVVEVEAHVRLLANLHGQLQFAGVRILWQGEQAGLFTGEGFAHGDRGLFPAGTIGGGSRAPVCGLSIEVVEVSEFARGKEILAYKPDCSFDATLLIPPAYGHRTRLEPMMPGECEQPRVEANRVTLTFKDGTFKIVV